MSSGSLASLASFIPPPPTVATPSKFHSLPVSDVQFGHVRADYRILVSENGSSSAGDGGGNRVSTLDQEEPYFAPSAITVKKGRPVTFRNDDFVIHTVTSTDATRQARRVLRPV